MTTEIKYCPNPDECDGNCKNLVDVIFNMELEIKYMNDRIDKLILKTMKNTANLNTEIANRKSSVAKLK